MKRFYFLLIVFFSLQVSGELQVQVETSSREIIPGETAVLNFSLRNMGDEGCLNARMELHFSEGLESTYVNLGDLGAGAVINGFFEVEKKQSSLAGVYATPLYLQCYDVNGKLISMVFHSTLNFNSNELPKSRAVFEDISVTPDSHSSFSVKIQNMGEADQVVFLNDYFPSTFVVEELPDNVSVPSKSVKTVEGRVKTFGALPGSSFSAYISTAYVDDDMRFETLSAGRVIVESPSERKKDFSFNPAYIAVGFILTVLFMYWKRKNNQ